MFDAEKLLGTVMREIVGSSTGYRKKQKKGKKKNISTLVNGLKSGTGLMTAIGLGIGAYEILRSSSAAPAKADQSAMPPVPPPIPDTGPTSPPPRTPATKPPALHKSQAQPDTQELARRMLQVMIAAAHADGAMDEAEEKAVLDHLREKGLGQEERLYLLGEMHAPKSLAALTAGIVDPAQAKAMYMVAVSAVDIDTEAERRWFDELAARLGISRAVQQFIEEQEG